MKLFMLNHVGISHEGVATARTNTMKVTGHLVAVNEDINNYIHRTHPYHLPPMHICERRG